MSEQKWTPGPWSIRWTNTKDVGRTKFHSFEIIAGDTKKISIANYDWPVVRGVGDKGPVAANAHLIAAAPDLVEAIKSFIGEIEDTPFPSAREVAGLTSFAALTAAYLKATGGEDE